MDADQGSRVAQAVRRCRRLFGGDLDPGFERLRFGAGQPYHFQGAEHLVLVVDVGNGAFEGGGVGRAGSHGVPRLQPQEERIGVPATAVQLDGEVELLPHHPREELLHGGGVGNPRTHAFRRWEDRHPADGARTVLQQGRVEPGAQEGDDGLRVGGLECLHRGQGEHQVPQAATPQDGDAVHVAEPLEDGAHQPRLLDRPTEFRPGFQTHGCLLKLVAKLLPP